MKTKWKVMAALLGAAGIANAAYVTIGDPGNDPDGTDYGAVSYEYKISATEVTIAEFQAATGAGNGDEDYWNTGDYSVGTAAPAAVVTLYEAMKYCNYLTSGNVNNGVYVFSGGVYQSTYSRTDIMENGVLDSVATDPYKIYALPTEDEWYKAAYYTGSGYSDYANGTDTPPGVGTDSNYGGTNGTWVVGTGTEEQNATYDMMGNVWEWMEDSAGAQRGGASHSGTNGLTGRLNLGPSTESTNIGFRPVEVVPEPATMGLLALAGGFALIFRRRFTA